MDSIRLKNSIMELNILKPGTLYKRSRFDWTGIVEQVSIGDTTFLGRESNGISHGTEGLGLSNEFGISTPLSYWKTLPGKEFMKIGIGALTRNSIKPYSFFKDYKVRPFNTVVKTYNDRVEFIQNSCHVGSYGYNYIKTIKILENSVTITYSLKNIGYTTIKTEEYNHNFLRINNRDISEQTMVKLNSPIYPKKLIGSLALTENKQVNILKENDLIYLNSKLKESQEKFSWEISDSNKSVTCVENFHACKFALWGMKHVISPEVFNFICIKPGDTLNWDRSYTFKI